MLLLAVLLLPAVSWASFCGENGVPFSLEVLPNGSPVLGCAQPSCIALAEGEDDSIFEADTAGNYDGYFRDEERTSHLQANKFKANCSGKFDAVTCPKKNQWVGGVDFVSDLRAPLSLQCCSFEGLRFSQDVGVTTIAPGEAVTGGEVIRDGRQISFDVIANVRKVLDPADHNKILYEVTVRRMNCLPDPSELQVPFDEDIGEEVQRVLGNDDNRAPLDRPEESQPTAPAAPQQPQEEAPELILETPAGPDHAGHGEEAVQVQPEIRQPITSPVEEERKEQDVNPNKHFFVHKKERQNQPTFGAPTFDPSLEAGATRVHPRFVEERPPSEYSTTQPPPTVSTTTTTLPPPTTPEIEPVVDDTPADYDPESVPAPKIAEKKTLKLAGVTTPAPPTTHNPFLLPGFAPFPAFPQFPPPPQPLQPPPAAPAAAFAAPPFLPLAPIPPPTHHHPHMHDAPQVAGAGAAAPNPFALPNPWAFPQLPNPWALPQQQPQVATGFGGAFGSPPAPQPRKVPGLEEGPTVVKPVVRQPMLRHGAPPGGAAPPAPAAAAAVAPTLAPLLMPPPFPTLFGPFPMGGQGRK